MPPPRPVADRSSEVLEASDALREQDARAETLTAAATSSTIPGAAPEHPTVPAGVATRRDGRPVTPSSRAARVLAMLAIVATLRLGRDILIPFVWAGFLGFVLTPLCRRLEALRIAKGLAATISVLALTAAMGAVVWMAAAQAVDLARRLPEYRRTLDAKFATLRTGGFAAPIMEAGERLKELEGNLAPPESGASPGAMAGVAGERAASPNSGTAPAPTPVPMQVSVVDAPVRPLERFGGVIESVVGPLGDIALIVLLSIFFTAYHADIRERIIRLGSRARIGITGRALEDAASRVTRYLVSNLAVNVAYGAAVGVSLYFIGVPNSALWAVLCALLRFIPYIGTWIGAVLPLAVSVAVFPGWSGTLWVLGAILAIDLVIGNVVEPLVYGHQTGLSPLIVILATVFWTWMWGLTGIVLAVPLTLCLAVAGRYVPGLAMLHVFLGDEPALDPSERVYDRLNAFDAEGAGRIVADEESRVGTAVAQDALLVAALRRAERERREGTLDDERFPSICEGVREALDELAPTPATALMSGRVLCIPALGEADRVACEVLVRLLEGRGVRADVGPFGPSSADAIDAAVKSGAAAVCFVSLPPFAPVRVRFFIQRARVRNPDGVFVGIVLDPSVDHPRLVHAFTRSGADRVAFGLTGALDAIHELVARAESAGVDAASTSAVAATPPAHLLVSSGKIP